MSIIFSETRTGILFFRKKWSDSKIRSATKQKFHFLKRAAGASGEGEIIHIWVVVFTHIWVVIMTLLQYDVSEPLERGMRTVH